MKNKVIIKGNRYGITIVLDPEIEFSELLVELKKRLTHAEEFFDSSKQIAAAFEGRELSNEELDQILSVIESDSKLNIQYVIDDNKQLETRMQSMINTVSKLQEDDPASDQSGAPGNFANTFEGEIAAPDSSNENLSSSGMFYKGTLRSGQTLESENSIVILGDVNPGASVIAGGNIVIIGSLTGSVQAGANGSRNAFVMALSMNPIQIQIADIIARSSDKRINEKKNGDLFNLERILSEKKDRKSSKQEAMIATVLDNHIYVESVSKSALQDIVI